MNIPLLKKLVTGFNSCLKQPKYQRLPFKENLSINDLMDSEQVIINRSGNSRLSQLFFRNYIPQSRKRVYHHFTSLAAFKGIIESEKLWLSCVSKRFGEKEFKPFYKAHKMDGYEKRETKMGIPLDQEICNNSFFLSLTGNDIDSDTEDHLAIAFSENRKGVKLVFRITKVKTDLRKVYYPADPKHPEIGLLKDFNNITRQEDFYLIFEGLSKFGFFYLPGLLSNEEEYRLLISRGKALGNKFEFEENADNYEFIKIPLFTNPLCEIKLTKVVLFDDSVENDVIEILKRNPKFSNVEVERKLK